MLNCGAGTLPPPPEGIDALEGLFSVKLNFCAFIAATRARPPAIAMAAAILRPNG
jgi:hypothetical protein